MQSDRQAPKANLAPESPARRGSPIQKRRVVAFRIITIGLAIVFAISAYEIGARLVESIKPLINRKPLDESTLNAYQMRDPLHADNRVLRPGFSMTLSEVIDGKRSTGRTLGAEYLMRRAVELGIHPGDTVFSVNRDGYKGPELDPDRHRLRILAIGDSCTFGSLIDKYSYPRTLENALRNRGVDAEVINAGVEGYSTQNVLRRIDEFKSLRPDVALIYIGWNDIYAKQPLVGVERYSHLARLIKRACASVQGRDTKIEGPYKTAEVIDPASPEVVSLVGYEPPYAADLERIAADMQSVTPHVVLLTLPGLFSTTSTPTQPAIQKGHLPSFTGNPFVLATLAESYNLAIRRLAEKDKLKVIDLQSWADAECSPRDECFVDSVHLTEEYQAALGEHLARELVRLNLVDR